MSSASNAHAQRFVRGSLGVATRHLPVYPGQNNNAFSNRNNSNSNSNSTNAFSNRGNNNNNALSVYEVENANMMPNRAVLPAASTTETRKSPVMIHRTSPAFAPKTVRKIPSSKPKHVANVANLRQHASRFRVPIAKKTNKRTIKAPIPFKSRKTRRNRRF